jgi:hypothetical protein
MLSFGERGYCNTSFNFGITRDKIPTTGLNKSNSIQTTICLSILYYNMMEKGSNGTTRLKPENIVIQLGYNAIALHANILLS